ncbi:MAG: hypothetical protein GWP91_07190 [Rhodobacterales bacterium]|nr:hypothetical protein [Rhodobacterales bacterium]
MDWVFGSFAPVPVAAAIIGQAWVLSRWSGEAVRVRV